MARIRTLKPDFFRSRSLSRVSVPARLTFQGLWCEADDHGRGVADERLLCGALWALDDDVTPSEVAGHLQALANTGHIRLYEVEGESYYEIAGWEKHQAASYRRGEAVHPPPPAQTPDPGTTHAESCKNMPDARTDVLEGNREGKGTGKGKDTSTRSSSTALAVVPNGSTPSTDGFEDFWHTYPKRNGKRLGRSPTEAKWKQLSSAERRAACVGAANLAQAVKQGLTLPKDPERFLKGRVWEDWQEPAEPEPMGRNGLRPSTVERSWRNILDGPTEGIR